MMQASEYVLLSLVFMLGLLCMWMYTKCGMYVDGLKQWNTREAEWLKLAEQKQRELVDLKEMYCKLRDDFVTFREADGVQWAARGTELSLANGKIAELEKTANERGKRLTQYALEMRTVCDERDMASQTAAKYERKIEEYNAESVRLRDERDRAEGERNHLFSQVEDLKAANTKLLGHLKATARVLHSIQAEVNMWGEQAVRQNDYDPILFNPTE